MFEYDFLVIGSGLAGSTFAYEVTQRGKSCLVIDKRDHIGGNMYTENIQGIHVHKYGAHIFHTDKEYVWDYINKFANFNNFRNCPIANYNGELYNLPFNMNTFHQMWGVVSPKEAYEKIKEEIEQENIGTPTNLEEQAIKLIGRSIYEKLVKGYTEKQWGVLAKDLPLGIITRLPVRYTYDNNYFNDRFQGIPIGGYTQIFEKMLEKSDVKLSYDFFAHRKELKNIAKNIVFTGCIDEFYNYKYGSLSYRSLSFEEEVLDIGNYQGNAVFNYTDKETPFTRIIEHKFFDLLNSNSDKTVITKEYPKKWEMGDEPFYPVNNKSNIELLTKYKELATNEKNVFFCGRLGDYKYYDMDKIIENVLKITNNIIV